jgi:hypothetical protein
MRRPRVEILYFDGCPNHEPARALVERLAAQLRIEPEIRLAEIADPEAAVAFRFLGSPTGASTASTSSRVRRSGATSPSPAASTAARAAWLSSRRRAGSARR